MNSLQLRIGECSAKDLSKLLDHDILQKCPAGCLCLYFYPLNKQPIIPSLQQVEVLNKKVFGRLKTSKCVP